MKTQRVVDRVNNRSHNSHPTQPFSKRSSVMNTKQVIRRALAALVSFLLLASVVLAGDFKNGGRLYNKSTKSFIVKSGNFQNYTATREGYVVNAGTINVETTGSFLNSDNAAQDGTVNNDSSGLSSPGMINVRKNYTNYDGATTFGGGTLKIAGALTSDAALTLSSATVEYDSSDGGTPANGDQNIYSATYGTLKALGTGTKTLLSTTAANTAFEVASGVTVAIGVNTLTLAGTVTATGFLTSGTTGTVEYTQSAAQDVFPASYGNLTLSGSGTKTASSGTVSIAGNYSNSVTLSAVNFTTVTGATFTGNSGTTKASGTVTIGDGLTVDIGGTFEYTTGGQSVASAQYTNLTISNASGTVTLPASVYISGSYSPSGAGSRDYATSSATLRLNGTSLQTISADASSDFYALAFFGNSQKDVTGTLATTSNFTIDASVTDAVGVRVTGSLTVGGNLENDGALTNEGTITVN